MNPVLIWTDTDKIRNEKAALTKYIPLLQAAYNAFLEKGVAVTIQDLANFTQWTRNNSHAFLERFVTDQLLVKASPAAMFNGVQIQRDKLRDMIVLPDLNGIPPLLYNILHSNSLNIRTNLLVLTNDVISKVPDADTQLEAEYTYYTRTDQSAQLATDLWAIANALNVLNTNYSLFKIKEAPNGLAFRNNAFGLSVNSIRVFEQLLAN